jgi:hypothetical protein
MLRVLLLAGVGVLNKLNEISQTNKPFAITHRIGGGATFAGGTPVVYTTITKFIFSTNVLVLQKIFFGFSQR